MTVTHLASEVDVLVPPSCVHCLASEVLLATKLRVGWVVQHPCGVHQHLAVILLPSRGQAPPPSLLLQPLRLHHRGVEGDVRQDSKLDSRVNQIRLRETTLS